MTSTASSPHSPRRSSTIRCGDRLSPISLTAKPRPPHSGAFSLAPSGGIDLTDNESLGFESFLVDLVGKEAAKGILVISAQFEEVRPTEPHFYLSLLATHRDHRGRGLGMGLLRENLERIDALGGAAHLESSNPVNDARYRSVGFEWQGEFTVASGHVITTMWRSAR